MSRRVLVDRVGGPIAARCACGGIVAALYPSEGRWRWQSQARPAFALERLFVLPDGRIAYAIKTARKGSTHRILTPVELIARIAALIPPPRSPFLR